MVVRTLDIASLRYFGVKH